MATTPPLNPRAPLFDVERLTAQAATCGEPESRERSLARAVALVLALDAFPTHSVPEKVVLSPKTREQLLRALGFEVRS